MAGSKFYIADDASLPQQLAEYTVALQDKVLDHKSHFDIAISGGSLPATLAKALLNNPDVRWDKYRVWLADERIVPHDHTDSNYRLFVEEILNKLPADGPRPTVYPVAIDKDYESTPSQWFAGEYQSRLVGVLGLKPKLDLVFLGMGPDAHTCSLFPGHPLLLEQHLFVSALDDSPKPPPRRVTLTLPALALADNLAFVATGEGKQAAFKAIFDTQDQTLPSAIVVAQAKREVAWFTDPQAVAGVSASAL